MAARLRLLVLDVLAPPHTQTPTQAHTHLLWVVAQAFAAHTLMEAMGAHGFLKPLLLGPEHANVDSEAFIKQTLTGAVFGRGEQARRRLDACDDDANCKKMRAAAKTACDAGAIIVSLYVAAIRRLSRPPLLGVGPLPYVSEGLKSGVVARCEPLCQKRASVCVCPPCGGAVARLISLTSFYQDAAPWYRYNVTWFFVITNAIFVWCYICDCCKCCACNPLNPDNIPKPVVVQAVQATVVSGAVPLGQEKTVTPPMGV